MRRSGNIARQLTIIKEGTVSVSLLHWTCGYLVAGISPIRWLTLPRVHARYRSLICSIEFSKLCAVLEALYVSIQTLFSLKRQKSHASSDHHASSFQPDIVIPYEPVSCNCSSYLDVLSHKQQRCATLRHKVSPCVRFDRGTRMANANAVVWRRKHHPPPKHQKHCKYGWGFSKAIIWLYGSWSAWNLMSYANIWFLSSAQLKQLRYLLNLLNYILWAGSRLDWLSLPPHELCHKVTISTYTYLKS